VVVYLHVCIVPFGIVVLQDLYLLLFASMPFIKSFIRMQWLIQHNYIQAKVGTYCKGCVTPN
jgi:hypothetical protein